jgi:hypothetical protein
MFGGLVLACPNEVQRVAFGLDGRASVNVGAGDLPGVGRRTTT